MLHLKQNSLPRPHAVNPFFNLNPLNFPLFSKEHSIESDKIIKEIASPAARNDWLGDEYVR